jgi:hypothetical protein
LPGIAHWSMPARSARTPRARLQERRSRDGIHAFRIAMVALAALLQKARLVQTTGAIVADARPFDHLVSEHERSNAIVFHHSALSCTSVNGVSPPSSSSI